MVVSSNLNALILQYSRDPEPMENVVLPSLQ